MMCAVWMGVRTHVVGPTDPVQHGKDMSQMENLCPTKQHCVIGVGQIGIVIMDNSVGIQLGI